MYTDRNVFEAALDRINLIFDHCDDVIVAISGGKDSTVVFNLALMVARERGRLPLKVFWLDQEVEWQGTVDYVKSIMYRTDVKPLWYQVPFRFPNNTSNMSEFIDIWAEDKKELWLHPQDPIAITECPIKLDKNQDKDFYVLIDNLPKFHAESQRTAYLDGMRIDESVGRRLGLSGKKATFLQYTWANKPDGPLQRFHPIYDFTFEDIWTAIAKNHWDYNRIYDSMYQYGVPKNNMRVSALVHETAYHHIQHLQEIEPQTYNKFVRRVSGIQTANQVFTNYKDYVPKELPFMFKDWKEYRDYLLNTIVQPEYREHFIKEWQGQDGEDFYRLHVRECIVNDTCGTLNGNFIVNHAYAKHKGVNKK